MCRTDPLIIGGGPAGAAAAIHLLCAGAQPTIIERQKETGDALCGGFLSWRTLERLERLGISSEMLGGHGVTVLRLFISGRSYEIPLPGTAICLSRKRLDSLLLGEAQRLGAKLRQGVAAQSHGPEGLRLDNGDLLQAESLFLATGKHDLRGLQRPRAAAGADPMLGLRLKLPPAPDLRTKLSGYIEMHFIPGGYLGLVLHETGETNACMAVRKSRLREAGGDPAAFFQRLADSSPALADRLAGMSSATPVDAIGHIPYGWRARQGEPGIFRLGDQAGVIASFAGEGIGLALASAECAASHWKHGGGAAALVYQKAFARQLRTPMRVAQGIASWSARPEFAKIPAALFSAYPALAGIWAKASRI